MNKKEMIISSELEYDPPLTAQEPEDTAYCAECDGTYPRNAKGNPACGCYENEDMNYASTKELDFN